MTENHALTASLQNAFSPRGQVGTLDKSITTPSNEFVKHLGRQLVPCGTISCNALLESPKENEKSKRQDERYVQNVLSFLANLIFSHGRFPFVPRSSTHDTPFRSHIEEVHSERASRNEESRWELQRRLEEVRSERDSLIEEARWERAPWIDEHDQDWYLSECTVSSEYSDTAPTEELSTFSSGTIRSQNSGTIVDSDEPHVSPETMEIDFSGVLLVLDESSADLEDVPMDTLIPEGSNMTEARLEKYRMAFRRSQTESTDAWNIDMGE